MDGTEALRVGVVGCGYQGGRLASAVALVPGLRITACADIDAEKAVQFSRSVESTGGSPVSLHTSAEDLLENAHVDVVMVATPHHVLAELALKAIQAGKHTLVEKPCGVNEAELARLEAAAEEAGVTCLAGYSFRYLPSWYKIHELVSTGVVGEIQAVMGCFTIGPLNDGWISRPETGGGPLLFLGSHLIDQVLWYVQDDPVEVFASVRYRHDTQVDETSSIQIGFARGATAQLLVSQAANRFYNQLELIGREGSISLRPSGFLDYEVVVSSSIAEAYQQPTVIHEPLTEDPRNIKHCRQLNEFVEAIRKTQRPFVTLQQGRRVMKVIDAIFASDRSGEPVAIT